jgi:hypothetical protein
MPDWKKEVGARLAQLQLTPEVREEVIAELAAHLEDCEGDGTISGSTVPPLSDTQWNKLSRNIQRTKREEAVMNHRTRSLWIPGMASLLGASLFMALLQWVGVRPRLIWVDAHMAMTFYWPWLASLPIFGAVGAYLSRRAGGEIRTRLAAGLSPVWWLFLLSIALFPMEMLHQGYHLPELRYYVLGMANWVAIPAFALFVGELPFLRAPQRASA